MAYIRGLTVFRIRRLLTPNPTSNDLILHWPLFTKLSIIMTLPPKQYRLNEIPAVNSKHDDVIKWKHFPLSSLGDFPPKGQWIIDVFLDLPLNKRLSKQSRRRWCNVAVRGEGYHYLTDCDDFDNNDDDDDVVIMIMTTTVMTSAMKLYQWQRYRW